MKDSEVRQALKTLLDVWEEANMAGMEGGCEAYNEAIGSVLTGPPDCAYCLKPREAGHHGCMCDD
tara:strand:+ start:497 stop:691 length:195 start_codon:yes stop_codon:yes gene_type:complete